MTELTELTYGALRTSMIKCMRGLPFRWCTYDECPECGSCLFSVIEHGGVTDGEPAVCCSCRRVWNWSVDDSDESDVRAYINDQRDHDEEQDFVTVEALATIRTEAEMLL